MLYIPEFSVTILFTSLKIYIPESSLLPLIRGSIPFSFSNKILYASSIVIFSLAVNKGVFIISFTFLDKSLQKVKLLFVTTPINFPSASKTGKL